VKLVLDASMSLAWLFERESAQEAECTERALLALVDTPASVPPIWHLEIANALLVGERRRVVTEAQVFDYLNRLSRLPIITDDAPPHSRRDAVHGLAREHDLSAYDAAYLELALRMDAALATFDRKLAEVARRAGGAIFES